jgi:hypothetical protein
VLDAVAVERDPATEPGPRGANLAERLRPSPLAHGVVAALVGDLCRILDADFREVYFLDSLTMSFD